MHRPNWRNPLRADGYTFVEALFQVVVFILFAQFIAYFFIWNSQLNETFTTTEELNWELFIHDIERYFLNVMEITVDEQSIVIQRSDEEKTIVINKINDVIRMQRNDEGNVPLLIGISDVRFNYTGNTLTITVEFQNGLKKERNIFVETSKE